MQDEICVVLSTAPSAEQAELIAETLVFEKLAACAQTGAPVKSYYIWKGESFKETETPISIKAALSALPDLQKRFMEIHPYECPQWIVLRAQASEKYAEWVNTSQKKI